MVLRGWVLVLTGLLMAPLQAQEPEAGFTQCLESLQQKAIARGLPEQLVADVLPGLQQQPRVLELDRRQPEFVQTFASYLNRRLTQNRIEQGRRLRREYAPFLAELTRQYGIPGQYLMAFWGLETNFGSYLGKMPTLDSLATLACDPRRSTYFTGELITALQLMQRESLSPREMQGSWAGAMGHTQFMPSAYRRYAIDGDADGRVDLWKSEEDALASGANFLQNLGWQRGERWGREVALPDDFDYAQSGLANRQPLAFWAAQGIRLTNGQALPGVDMQASLILPAGHAGPAFLVYKNFHVIMGWNRSVSYALSVGLLADRIAGAGGLLRPPPTEEQALSLHTISLMQEKLNAMGFDAGKADGIMGPGTRAALRRFQATKGMIADGYPDAQTLGALQLVSDS